MFIPSLTSSASSSVSYGTELPTAIGALVPEIVAQVNDVDSLLAQVTPIYNAGASRISNQMNQRMDDACNKSMDKTFRTLMNSSGEARGLGVLMSSFICRLPGLVWQAKKLGRAMQHDIKDIAKQTSVEAKTAMDEILCNESMSHRDKKSLKKEVNTIGMKTASATLKDQLRAADLYTPPAENSGKIKLVKKAVERRVTNDGYERVTYTASATFSAKVKVDLSRF